MSDVTAYTECHHRIRNDRTTAYQLHWLLQWNSLWPLNRRITNHNIEPQTVSAEESVSNNLYLTFNNIHANNKSWPCHRARRERDGISTVSDLLIAICVNKIDINSSYYREIMLLNGTSWYISQSIMAEQRSRRWINCVPVSPLSPGSYLVPLTGYYLYTWTRRFHLTRP